MNRIIMMALLTLAVGLAACSSRYQVKQEYPKSPNLDRYEVIRVGWVDFPAGNWRAYGFRSQGEWAGVTNDLNRKSLNEYLAGALNDRDVIGPTTKSNAIPGRGDLFIKLGYKGIRRQYSAAGGFDYLTVRVEFYDIRRRRRVYGATVTLSSARSFPHNWKGAQFEGRLDNEIYNLAQFIASKF
ncbi:MAG: hypothetical protein JW838_06125 [Spirochaetes bacterium]|nr:hypothetical protein [Spirochaetota bacterium]